MKKLFLLIAAIGTTVSAQAPSCKKPYQVGHFTQLGTEDLRTDRTRPISNKESKEWTKKQTDAQIACNVFVSQHPNLAVSKEFSFTVKRFVTVRERCDSFCGTEKELEQRYEQEKKQ